MQCCSGWFPSPCFRRRMLAFLLQLLCSQELFPTSASATAARIHRSRTLLLFFSTFLLLRFYHGFLGLLLESRSASEPGITDLKVYPRHPHVFAENELKKCKNQRNFHGVNVKEATS